MANFIERPAIQNYNFRICINTNFSNNYVDVLLDLRDSIFVINNYFYCNISILSAVYQSQSFIKDDYIISKTDGARACNCSLAAVHAVPHHSRYDLYHLYDNRRRPYTCTARCILWKRVTTAGGAASIATSMGLTVLITVINSFEPEPLVPSVRLYHASRCRAFHRCFNNCITSHPARPKREVGDIL